MTGKSRFGGIAPSFKDVAKVVPVLVGLSAIPAFAQAPGERTQAEQAGGGGVADIVVTARKRDETVLRTPVIVDVLTSQKLEQLHVTSAYALTSVIPSLTIVTGGSYVGVTAALRGLGNGASANFADQTVALNLDGLTAPSGAFYRAGLFDIGQIEVLKGPQALFFGKSTSGGVIALHTADPTKEWDSMVSGSYEFDTDEKELTGFLSGPLTDTLGIRIAGTHSRSKGFLVNLNPDASDHRKQSVENDGARLTLAYDGNSGLKIKLKGFVSRNRVDGDLTTLSNSICPSSVTPFTAAGGGIYDDCKLDRTTIGFADSLPYKPGNYGPTDFAEFATGSPSPLFTNGSPYGKAIVAGIPLQVDYEVANGLTLTSLTGWQYSKFTSQTPYGLNVIFGLGARDSLKELSQELRLSSDWKDSWINFTAGGLVSDSRRKSQFVFVIPVAAYYSRDDIGYRSKQGSAFAQLLLTPIDKLEISAGARYTQVHRYFTRLDNFVNFLPATVDNLGSVDKANRDKTENDFSPEVTLTYRPSDSLTVFGSYKQGYKAFSFNAVLTAPAFNDTTISPYNGERVEGFEGGVKGKLFDNHLAFTLTGYRYNYDGLQVSFTDIPSASVLVANGADARVQGIEVTGDYSPPGLPGLTLSAALNYNDAYFRSFPASPCYASQTVAQGCTTLPSGVRAQDQAGKSLPFAAKWSGNIGFDYATEVGDGYMIGVNARAALTSRYQTSPERNPFGLQKAYALIDAGLRFGRENQAWELSLLCRNCTNRFYLSDTVDAGAVTVPGEPSPVFARLARPRQIMLQLTVRPGRL